LDFNNLLTSLKITDINQRFSCTSIEMNREIMKV